MFKKKTKILTTADAPDSIAPWEMLDDADIAAYTARLRERFPDRFLVAIARRLDRDTIACFDRGMEGNGKSISVFENFSHPHETRERRYPGFSTWFDAALADAQQK
jgi:hypothetical protein